MKTDELEKLGLNKDQVAAVMKANGKDIEELKRENQTLTTDRDNWQKRAETAEGTLKNFDGKDYDGMVKDRDAWKEKFLKLEEEQKLADEKVTLEKAIEEHVSGLTFKDEYRKRAYIEDLRKAGYQVKDGKLIGASEFQKSYDADAFIDEKQKELEERRAKFTDKTNQQSGGGALTKDQIMAVQDRAERRKLISENMDLFRKGE